MPQLSAWPPSGTGTAQQPMTVEELEMRLNAQVGLGGGVSVGDLEPTEAEKARMRKTYEDVRAIVLKAFPHGRLEVFGSAATPLMVRNSNDIDMTLLMDDLMQLPDDPESDPEDDASTDANPPAPDGQKPGGTSDAPPGGSRVVVVPVGGKSPPGPGRGAAQTDGGPEGATPARKRRPPKRGQRTKAHAKVVEEVAAVIREAGMEGVEAITTSRIPLLKFKHRETRVSCDITINNLLALYNTRMLADYCRIDDRLRRITMIIKHWAKQRAINEAYRGTLSSYCYAVMAIHLLQTQDPPILPCLQDPRRNFPERIVNGYNTGYDEAAVDSLTNFGQQNQMGLGLLLWNFFLYWHVRHDYLSDVVSIRTPGGFVSKEQKGWTKRQGLDRHLICIEDPFNVDHDLGRVVDKDSMKILGKEFRVAVETLRYNGDHPLDTLFFRFAGNKLSREQQKATMGGRRRQGGGEQQQGNGAPVRRVA
ncbi:unnamed protein product [Pedinophyceae sp. YPF-701]|nr:unnamed protein product [Pedinophyceae sp. YPF-701]